MNGTREDESSVDPALEDLNLWRAVELGRGEWMSRDEAAAYARVSVRTIDRAIAAGRLRSGRAGTGTPRSVRTNRSAASAPKRGDRSRHAPTPAVRFRQDATPADSAGQVEPLLQHDDEGGPAVTDDPRFDDTVGLPQIAGLVVAFKALLVRAGGRVEITEAELEHARTLLARVDVTPEVMTVELVDGDPPDTPRFAAEGAMTFAEVLEGLRAALAGLETVPEADLDEPTRRLRDNTRAMLDRYDRDERDA